MASAAPSKRMVSSVFITLVTPSRATVTQQQTPDLQTYSTPVLDNQQIPVRISPTGTIPNTTYKKHNVSPETNGIRAKNKDESHFGASGKASSPQSPRVVQPEPVTAKPHTDFVSSPIQCSSVGTLLVEEMPLPPLPPVQKSAVCPLTSGQQPVYNREVETSTPSIRLNRNLTEEKIHITNQDTNDESKDVCGFCRKPVNLTESAIEALNRTYHETCFQCRSCHIPLACKQYYNKAGIPLCEDCYQASLELCWTCGEVIKYQVMRALERAYHPSCFTCTTCKQQIGEQRFAQGEVGEVYCLPDYYRKYAPQCNACNQLIIPKEDGTDSYTVECLGHSYHENCYRCEVCFIHLTPEPNEHGCYPLDGKMLCKPCHLSLVSVQHGQ